MRQLEHKPSYTKAAKGLTFKKFVELFGWVEYFKLLDQEGWEREYERATGRKPEKDKKD